MTKKLTLKEAAEMAQQIAVDLERRKQESLEREAAEYAHMFEDTECREELERLHAELGIERQKTNTANEYLTLRTATVNQLRDTLNGVLVSLETMRTYAQLNDIALIVTLTSDGINAIETAMGYKV